MKQLILFSILIVFSFSTFAQKAKTWEPLDKMSKSDMRSLLELKKVHKTLSEFKFSNDKEVRAKEIQAYLKLSLKAVQADETKISQEYLHETYLENRKDFDEQIRKMKEIDRKTIIDSLKYMENSLKNPEGS